jgi:hypothetical protein
MDAEKFVLTVIMGFIIAVVDARITSCPKCGAAEDFEPGMTRDMIGTGGPVVRGKPSSGSMDDLVKVVAVIAGIGATLVGCVLLLSGVASWVVGGSSMSPGERVLVGLSGVGAAIIAIPLGIQASTWGWRRGFLPPVVKCKSCGWRDPKYAV